MGQSNLRFTQSTNPPKSLNLSLGRFKTYQKGADIWSPCQIRNFFSLRHPGPYPVGQTHPQQSAPTVHQCIADHGEPSSSWNTTSCRTITGEGGRHHSLRLQNDRHLVHLQIHMVTSVTFIVQ